MSYKQAVFGNNQFYHLTNRGVEKRLTFVDEKDCQRFIETLKFYRSKNPPSRFSFRNRPNTNRVIDPTQTVEVISYCLMPNHFHLLIKQLETNGVSSFLSKVTNSYTKYFNTRHQRVGPLFQGSFKAVRIENTDQLLQISKYIHLNPYLSYIVKDLKRFPYSSYPEFIGETDGFCKKEAVLKEFNTTGDYENFVLDQEDYQKTIPEIEHLILEELR